MRISKNIFDSSRPGRRIAANIYQPDVSNHHTKSKQPVTLLLAHANGFHKELWEPVLSKLFTYQLNSQCKWYISKAIAIDSYNHGDSAILNRDLLETKESWTWFENARDIISVVRQIRSTCIGDLIGVGHSWGASTLLLCEIISPCTFSSLILTDPGLSKIIIQGELPMTIMTKRRRYRWESRKEAQEYFESHQFFCVWDKYVLELYLKYGLEDCENEGVVLKCRPEDEISVYEGMRVASFYISSNIWRIQCPVAFLTGEMSDIAEPNYFKEVISPVKNRMHKILKGVGHLIIHQTPELTASTYTGFLDTLTNEHLRANLLASQPRL